MDRIYKNINENMTEICLNCGTEFHIHPNQKDKTKFCSKKCCDEFKKGVRKGEYETLICPSCGQEFESLKSKHKKYCSDKCKKEHNELYTIAKCDYCNNEVKILKTKLQERLDKNANHKFYCSANCGHMGKMNGEKVKCSMCGKEYYLNPTLTKKSELHFCSNECQGKYQTIQAQEIRTCEMCGNEYVSKKISEQRFCSVECQIKWQSDIFSQTLEFKEKHRKIAISNLSKGLISTTNSGAQIKINKLLDSMKIKYKNEMPFVYYSADNYLLDHNLIIEVQGDFWHTNPLIYRKIKYQSRVETICRDKAKHTYIKNQNNIEILYLWEKDINENLDVCEKLIQKYIKKNGVLDNYHSFNYFIDDNEELKIKDVITIPYQDMIKQELNKYINLKEGQLKIKVKGKAS